MVESMSARPARKARPALTAIAVLTSCLAAIALAPRAAGAHAKSAKQHSTGPYGGRLLPKGTPYAAEVRAAIKAKVTISQGSSQITNDVCESQKQIYHSNSDYQLAWNVTYNQVTVPVASAKELGRAYRRLHIKPTPTSPGRDHGSKGTYDLSGDGPSDTELCDSVKYGQQGRVRIKGRPSFTQAQANRDDAIPRALFFFTMPTIVGFKPSKVTDSLGNKDSVESDFSGLATSIPSVRQHGGGFHLLNFADWDALGASFDIAKLRKLRVSKTVRLAPIERSGHLKGCESTDKTDDSTGGTSNHCESSFKVVYHVTLKRHFLYRSKHTYRRK